MNPDIHLPDPFDYWNPYAPLRRLRFGHSGPSFGYQNTLGPQPMSKDKRRRAKAAKRRKKKMRS